MILTEKGEIWMFGRGEGGQLGLADSRMMITGSGSESPEVYCSLPKKVYGLPPGKKVVQIAAGDAHSLALMENGVVYGWGFTASGQLGNGNTLDNADGDTTKIQVKVPKRITSLANKKIVDVKTLF